MWSLLTGNLLEMLVGWSRSIGGVFKLRDDQTFVVTSTEDTVRVLSTRHKDQNSVTVFERVVPGSVFNQQPETWSEVRNRHPYTLLGESWCKSLKPPIELLTTTYLDDHLTGDLQTNIRELMFEVIFQTAFGLPGGLSMLQQFENQTSSVNRQLTFRNRPISPWFYWGRYRWFQGLRFAYDHATPDSGIGQLKQKGLVDRDHSLGELSGFFWGGLYSLTNIVTGGMFYLSQHPVENVHQLILETLRLCPSAAFLFRETEEELVLEETTIPEGSQVGSCPYALHRNPSEWDKPDEFQPERHPTEGGDFRSGFIPFGVPTEEGGRECVGKGFGMVVMETVMKTIMDRYEVSVDQNELEVESFVGALRLARKYQYTLVNK